MSFLNVHLLPLSIFVLFPATFFITYSISVLLGHTEPDFPYISDTGTYSPESCIFGQALNIGAFLVVITVYVRYRQIAELYHTHSSQSTVVRANKAAAAVGWVSAAGISLVANFQETNMLPVHLTGALLAFGGATVYLWLQALCSYQTHPLLNSLAVAHLRLVLAVISAIFFVLGCICAALANATYDGNDRTKWYPTDGGWQFHVVSTASEWICAAMFDVFMLTLVSEFKNISVDFPQVYVNIETLTQYSSQYSGHFTPPNNGNFTPQDNGQFTPPNNGEYSSPGSAVGETQGRPLGVEVQQILTSQEFSS